MPSDPRRQIVGFMAGAVAFAIVGRASTTGATSSPLSALSLKSGSQIANQASDVTIVLGGAIATVLLVLLSEAGDTAATLAKGLAGVTLVGSVLLNGKPVFAAISRLTAKGSTPVATTNSLYPTGGPNTNLGTNTSYMPPVSSKG